MSPVIEKFLERPTSHKAAFWVASLALIIGIFWQYFYSPLRGEATKLEEKVFALQSKVTQEQRIAKNLNKFKAEVASLNEKFKVALKELPDKREIPELLDSISTLARDAGLEVTVFQPRGEIMKDFYAEVPVSVGVEGTYHQLATFFDEVGHMDRIVNVNEISVWQPFFKETRMVRALADDPTGKALVRATCNAVTFRYLDESERVKPESQEDKKKKRRKE